MDNVKRVKVMGRYLYFRRGAGGLWRRITKDAYDKASRDRHDFRHAEDSDDVSGDYLGDDGETLTPAQEQLFQQALYEKTMREMKAKQSAADKAKAAAKDAAKGLPGYGEFDKARDAYDKAQQALDDAKRNVVNNTTNSVVEAEAGPWLLIGLLVLVVASKRRRR